MKRTLCALGVAAVLALAGCGSEKANEEPDKEPVTADNSAQDEEPAESTEQEASDSEDATESDEGALDLEEGDAIPLKYYGTEESYAELENSDEAYSGAITHDFEGFVLKSVYFLVDFKPNEEYLYAYDEKENIRGILVMMMAENTTDHDVDYNGTMTITTDTKEQVNGESGVMSSNQAVMTYYGNVESAGYYLIPLKDGSDPNEITVMLDPPYEVIDGSVDPINGIMGEGQRFTIQGYVE